MKRLARFSCSEPYAIISFVGSRYKRSAPKLLKSPHYRGRIVIRADDVDEDTDHSVALSEAQAARIARFVYHMRSQVTTLFIHCVHGAGRSPAAAVAIGRVLDVPVVWRSDDDGFPNEHIIAKVFQAMQYWRYKKAREPQRSGCGQDKTGFCD